MLKAFLIAVGAAAVLFGALALYSGTFPPAVVFGCWGAILLILLLVERVIYKPLRKAHPGAGFERTTERFVDDETGKTVTVFVDPATGERAYVQE